VGDLRIIGRFPRAEPSFRQTIGGRRPDRQSHGRDLRVEKANLV
jgi:hypothetical protein